MDVEAVFRSASELYDHSRAGNGPAFLIANCYRYYGHGRKDPSPYRAKEEEAEWRKKDPVELQKARLISAGLLDTGSAEAMVHEVADEMEAAVKWAANASMPEPADLWTGVYAD
jgi:pyruvate dehydrogenase E1 component alpha subunit